LKDSKNYILLIVILGLFVSATSFGQSPCFMVDNDTICVGQRVTFTRCPDWKEVIYDFGDGRGVQPKGDTFVIYNEPGIKNVIQLGNDPSNNVGQSGPMQIVVTRLSPPMFTLSNCKGGKGDITLNDNIYKSYTLDSDFGTVSITNGNKVTLNYPTTGIKTIKITGTGPSICTKDTTYSFEVYNDVTTPAITNLNVQSGQINLTFDPVSLKEYLQYKVELKEGNGSYYNAGNLTKNGSTYTSAFSISSVAGLSTISPSGKQYCARITAYDNCGNAASEEVCSILLDAQALVNQNAVKWSSQKSFTDFSLNEDGTQIALSGSSNNYTNNDIICNKQYCYSIIGTVGNQTVQSNEICISGRSNKIPPAVESLNASVENNQIQISWASPGGIKVKEFVVSRLLGTELEILYQGPNASFTDESANVSSSKSCYTVHYVDSCGNSSPASNGICNIVLSTEMVAKDNNRLQWSEFVGWENGVREYVVEYLDEGGNVYKEVVAANFTQFQDTEKHDEQVLRYRIKAVSNDPVPLLSFSNISEIKQNFLIVLPNAFTPNGDGKNEDFHPVGRFIKSYVMQIYTKWGELIFEGENWDGRGKNGPAPSGTYVYFVEAEDYTKNKITKKGSLILIR
jgi:gliding motility-associated-like protein